MDLNAITVFCGSRPGARPIYADAARALAEALAARHLGLVYGGASVGLMGVLADRAIALGVRTVGVIPEWLVEREIVHLALTESIVTPNMHARKQRMSDLAGGYVAMPGGYGTFDELFEVLTWAQIGLHRKPIGLLDVDGYFAPLLAMVDRGVTEGFIAKEHRALLHVHGDPGELLDAMARAEPKDVGITKWEDARDRT